MTTHSGPQSVANNRKEENKPERSRVICTSKWKPDPECQNKKYIETSIPAEVCSMHWVHYFLGHSAWIFPAVQLQITCDTGSLPHMVLDTDCLPSQQPRTANRIVPVRAWQQLQLSLGLPTQPPKGRARRGRKHARPKGR